MRLLKEKPAGVAGLAFVLTEIRMAQSKGLIRKPKASDRPSQNKLFQIFEDGMKQKLSKQQKDKELIKCLKIHNKKILDKLIKESAFSQEDKMEEQAEKMFQTIAEQQQDMLAEFFSKVDTTMSDLNEDLKKIKSQVECVE